MSNDATIGDAGHEPESPPPEVPRLLPPTALRVECDPACLGFSTTSELEPLSGFFGQDRAAHAIRFGTGIRQPGYNCFVLGPAAAGGQRAIRAFLCERARAEPAPDDFAYVNNFDDSRRPRALRLPPGRAQLLRNDMQELVGELGISIPSLFESEEYKSRRRAVDEAFENAQEKALEALETKAGSQDIAILRTPMGFAFAPKENGQIVTPDDYRKLPRDRREEIGKKIEALQDELRSALEKIPQMDKERRKQIRSINNEMARSAIKVAIADVYEHFKDIPAVTSFLSGVEHDLVENVELFLKPTGTQEDEPAASTVIPARDTRLRRYAVNVMVSSGDCSKDAPRVAPVVHEEHPTLANLIGRIEHVSHMGALLTDFTLIQPGSLHRANGGYIIIDALSILRQPFAWDALKRALRTEVIAVESALDQMSLTSTTTLEPEPIPLSIKVVLVGDRQLYHLLAGLDPDFPKLFKVQVEFDDETVRSAENLALFSRFVANVIRDWKLRPFDAGAVAALSEEASRIADDSERLSLHTSRLADLVRETDYWAGEAGATTSAREHVEKAVAEQTRRADRIREKAHEAVARGIVLVDLEGEKIGQINGLSVLSIGDFRFGRPTRITARVRMGTGKVIDIEREVELGGPIHSKGVLILSSFLATRYALDEPISMAASLVFEQSYGGVEGDSASAAELFVLMSALSGLPLRQSLAVTGSINQLGEIQAIGGVNEKIEGFFDVCAGRGLNGQHGVIIPASNVKHLMLRREVVKAASDGRFRIYAIRHVDEGIALLARRAAGERTCEGAFPAGSVNGLIEEKLRTYAQLRRRYVTGAAIGKTGDDKIDA
ncbi:Lon protease family protein [Taklimakanibacter lacteus]|uniref:Lon protease family protein n=1 Tax=Taklimakanibacter lacteus TaxID=2268456 RepID=UPI0013C520B5